MEHPTRRVGHNSRLRMVAVVEKGHVTPRMSRIVLGGENLAEFTTPSADDHRKLYVPGEGSDLEARDFILRHFDAHAKKLTIDIALHPAGPAIHWAEQAPLCALYPSRHHPPAKVQALLDFCIEVTP
jgi:NADPH-dependent ferric siderophore reductase